VVVEGRKSGHLGCGLGDKMVVFLGAGCEKAMRRAEYKNGGTSSEVIENKRPMNDKISSTLRS